MCRSNKQTPHFLRGGATRLLRGPAAQEMRRLLLEATTNPNMVRILFKESLEFASFAFYDIFTFLGVGHCLTIFLLLLLMTPLSPLVLLYLIYTLVTWKTPRQGGSIYGRHFMLNSSVFTHMRDFFPISLSKTAELDPRRNYVFGYHPHAILPDGAVVAFGSDALGFSEMLPGIVPHLTSDSSKYSRKRK